MTREKSACIVLAFFILLFLVFSCVCDNIVFNLTIDQRIQNIMHPQDDSVMLSSRPEDYIRASPDDYKYIVDRGRRSLNYMLYKFSQNNESGGEQYIMAIACSQILQNLGQASPQNWISGRDWYDKYRGNTQ